MWDAARKKRRAVLAADVAERGSWSFAGVEIAIGSVGRRSCCFVGEGRSRREGVGVEAAKALVVAEDLVVENNKVVVGVAGARRNSGL